MATRGVCIPNGIFVHPRHLRSSPMLPRARVDRALPRFLGHCSLHRKIVKFKRDEVYIGSAEERAANAKADPEKERDNEEKLDVVPGHMYPGVPTLPPDFIGVHHSRDECDDLEADLIERKKEIEYRLKKVRAEKAKYDAESDEEEA